MKINWDGYYDQDPEELCKQIRQGELITVHLNPNKQERAINSNNAKSWIDKYGDYSIWNYLSLLFNRYTIKDYEFIDSVVKRELSIDTDV